MLEVGNNLSGYKVVFSVNISRFYLPQWQWNARCDDAVSINRSITLINVYYNNRLIDYDRLIVAALLEMLDILDAVAAHLYWWCCMSI